MKIALAVICKGSNSEADYLRKLLENTEGDVDGVFVTITHKKGEERNAKVEKVCNEFKAIISDFEWVNDFSKARNFNFAQVTKDFDYVLWADTDDQFRGLARLKGIIESKPADGYAMWYLYHFDNYKQADVVHKKLMVIKNDDATEWVGALHEEMIQKRELNLITVDKYFNGGIDRMHMTNDDRAADSKARNVEVSKADFDINSNDPRTHWNYAQSLYGAGKYKKALKVFEDFVEVSGSDEEIYIAYLRMADIHNLLGNRKDAIRMYQTAIGMHPEYPDGYFNLGYVYQQYDNLDKAETYLLFGLKMKPQYHSIIVYNPRDYDYNPMMLLSKIYTAKNRPDLAVPMIKGCLEIYPDNPDLKKQYDFLVEETRKLGEIVTEVQRLSTVTDKELLKTELAKLPAEYQSHPAVCMLRNRNFTKLESSGKDLVIYCYPTGFDWNPDLFKEKGFGGSEEAVINLSKGLARLGWNVTVYNRCGIEPKVYDGVTYKPFWMWNARDVEDVLIIWRHPRPVDYDLGAKKVYLDVHDTIPAGEFTKERLKKLDKIFVKTKAHRSLYPDVLEEKFIIIPNGQDFELFNQDVKKDPYLLVNTSSPDRSMDVLPKLFKEVKKQVPEARLKWAYGFDLYEQSYNTEPIKMNWMYKCIAEMKDAGIEVMGRLPQAECAKLYLEGSIFAYPSEFFEIDCISVKKAQACGAYPITTNFAAFKESVGFGDMVKSKKNNSNWFGPYKFTYGLEDEEGQKQWVDMVVNRLKNPSNDIDKMKEWCKQFSWDNISNKWNEELK